MVNGLIKWPPALKVGDRLELLKVKYVHRRAGHYVCFILNVLRGERKRRGSIVNLHKREQPQ